MRPRAQFTPLFLLVEDERAPNHVCESGRFPTQHLPRRHLIPTLTLVVAALVLIPLTLTS
eukprot:1890176-Pleurochrysis_carterae.AAC.1